MADQWEIIMICLMVRLSMTLNDPQVNPSAWAPVAGMGKRRHLPPVEIQDRFASKRRNLLLSTEDKVSISTPYQSSEEERASVGDHGSMSTRASNSATVQCPSVEVALAFLGAGNKYSNLLTYFILRYLGNDTRWSHLYGMPIRSVVWCLFQ